MAGNSLNFTLEAVANPWIPPAGYSIIGDPSKIFNTGAKYWTLASGANSFCVDETVLTGTLISCEITAGFVNTSSIGAALLDSSGNGYTARVNTNDNSVKIFRVDAGVISATLLWTSTSFTFAASDKIRITRNTDTNEYTIHRNGVQLFNSGGQTFTSATHLPNRAAAHSRYGYVAAMESIFTPAQSITSINGGNPIEAGQSSVPVVHSGFGGAITSITTNRAGVSASVISGDADSTTFSISGWVDGGEYPLLDSYVTFTFSRSGESAAAAQTVTAPDGYSQVTFSSPDTSDDRKFSKMMVDAGLTVDGSTLYYKTDTIPDLVINTDSSGEPVANGGTFEAFLREVDTGIMRAWTITINEQGVPTDMYRGLTSKGLAATGFTATGLTAVGL